MGTTEEYKRRVIQECKQLLVDAGFDHTCLILASHIADDGKSQMYEGVILNPKYEDGQLEHMVKSYIKGMKESTTHE